MKNLTRLTTLTLLLSVLVACGGGETTSEGSGAANQTPTKTHTLIVDNGRGTLNNQNTEKP